MSIEKLSAEPPKTRGVERSADTFAVTDVSCRSGFAGRWLGLIVLPLVFGLYVRAVGFAGVYDDNVSSPWGSLRDVPKFFAHDIFGFDGNAHSVYYRPLAMTWGLLVGLLGGGTVAWMHLSAILLHMAVVVLAYIFGRHLFEDDRVAMLTAVLFGLHPSKVESVAWIGSSCVDGLCAVFFFASLIAFLKWRESEAASWLSGSVALFACAMFTKETMVFIPMLIAVYLWLDTPAGPPAPRGAERILRIAKTLLPYGVVWTVYMAIRHQVIKPVSASATYYSPTFTLTNVWTAPYAIWWYIRHLVLPWGLSVEYANKTLDRPALSGFVLPALGLLLLLVAAFWLWSRQRSKLAAFLMFWFVVTLAPPVIVAPMVHEHDRYLYVTSYAFCALVAWVILRLGSVPEKARWIAALCVVALWAGLTWHEMGYWECDAKLWARSLEVSPTSLLAQMHTAQIYEEAGDPGKALSIVDDGLRYRPNEPNLWVVRAKVLQENKRLEEARSGYLKVLQLTDPANRQSLEAEDAAERAAAEGLRTVAAFQLAVLDFSTKNFVEAEYYARLALSLNPKGITNHMALSRSLREQGRLQEADAEDAIIAKLQGKEGSPHP